ncbi:MAG: DNA polymerase III subunit delta [Pseudomonadales bacterium]|nr:MAG: DNA polymerase III subunit delta [Pseudomonadales bacterium]
MKQNFLDTYRSLKTNQQPNQKQSQPAQPLGLQLSGLWLAHGDEPLMSQWLIEALRPHWRQQGQSVQRIELVSTKTWQDVLTELDSLSLFDPASAIIVTGNHKPDKSVQQFLTEFAQRVNSTNNSNPSEPQNHLLWITQKQDKRSLSAKWIEPFSQNGLLIDCNLYNEQQRQQILQFHATQFGFQLTHEAWQLLMTDTQNNLLNAYQSLWRLSDLLCSQQPKFSPTQPPPKGEELSSPSSLKTESLKTVGIEELQSAIVSEASYNVYDLSDAMLAGDSQQVVTIIEGLKAIGESPMRVLWSVSKDMRLIQQLYSGKSPQEIGIWSSKQRLYFNAMHRNDVKDTAHWSQLIFDCDRAIKGVIKQPAWELLLQSALQVSGVSLLRKL